MADRVVILTADGHDSKLADLDAIAGGTEVIAFAFGDVASRVIYTASAGSRIARVYVDITTAFNTAATIEIGTAGDTDLLFAASQSNLQTTDIYSSTPLEAFLSSTDIYLTYTQNGATQGSGLIYLEVSS